MDPQTFLDLIFESIQESARQARLSSGRPLSQATLKEALQQVAMLEAAKEAQTHPDNVFIDEVTSLPICIDCIVKFVKTPKN